MNVNIQKLRKKAEIVLQNNDEGDYTVPSRTLYPHQWAWDSAFSAIGWSFIEPERALKEIERLFHYQWKDGRIPQIIFNPKYHNYFPGPDFWESGKTSSITQPPVYATALKFLLRAGCNKNSICELIPKVELAHKFFRLFRDPDSLNLVSVVHPWESGMDNSPSWDKPLSTIDDKDIQPFKRKDTISNELSNQRPTDKQYRKYATIVKQIKSNNFLCGEFNVYDPMMTVMLAVSELDLADICEQLGIETDAYARFQTYKDSLDNYLYSDIFGRYSVLDSPKKSSIPTPSISSLFPLLLENINQSLRDVLEKEFLSPFGIRSTSIKSDEYDPICYWRGPVWMNINWLFRDILSVESQIKILQNIERHGFYEYFHPETGKGLGSDNFSWTAALCIETIDRVRKER